MQLDPGLTAVDPALAFRDFQRLKLKYDALLSNFACFGFNFDLRPCSAAQSSPCHVIRQLCVRLIGGAVQVDPGLTVASLGTRYTRGVLGHRVPGTHMGRCRLTPG